MGFLLLPWHYLYWHYFLAWSDYWQLFYNFLVFTARWFSLSTLLRTLFAPWRRLGEAYPKHFDPNAFLAVLIVNTLMRVVGLIIRLVLLLVGVAACLVVVVLGIVAAMVWLILPVLIPALIVFGAYLMFEVNL